MNATAQTATRLAAAIAAPQRPPSVTDQWRTRPLSFFYLASQLLLLLVVVWQFRVETPTFLLLCALVFSAFLVHYWLPPAWKEPFLIAVSLAGAFVLLDPVVATALLVIGLTLYAIVAAPLAFRARILLVVGLFTALAAARVNPVPGVPAAVWPVLGAIFMFRVIVYLYDLAHAPGRPSLIEFLAYFFLLPNFYFLLFPVIDFKTMRRSYGQRDIHEVAQQGIHWILRGVLHLLLYRVIYHYKGARFPAEQITSLPSLLAVMVLTYLLYLRVSGHFHIIVGMLHLFGYDLPETNRKYLLAGSVADFWRRINIYWKDFMVKVFYFPVFFHLRRSGEVRAQFIATGAVFLATWALHSYQYFWLAGSFPVKGPDIVFWSVLGIAVAANLVIDMRKRKPAKRAPWLRAAQHAVQVVLTFGFIVVLWSLWNAPTLADWDRMLRWWR